MKILVATDGSRFAKAAVEFVKKIVAEPASTEIEVVAVVEPFAPNEFETLVESLGELTDPSNPAAQVAGQLAKSAGEELSRTFDGTGIKISDKVIGGLVAKAIVEEAERWRPDLIVLGSHGRGFWSRQWLGSVSDRVAHHAHCSVLLVKEDG